MFRNSQICQHCIFINWFNIFFFIQILSMTFTGLENQGIINIITVTRSYWTQQLCTNFKVFWYTWLYNDVNDNNEIMLPSAITELFGVKSFLQDFSCGIRLISGRQCRSLERKIIFQFFLLVMKILPELKLSKGTQFNGLILFQHCIIELS